MVNVVLIITTVIFAVLVVLGSIYFLVYFQDPADKWIAWLPKLVVVTGLSIACYNVLLLPLDVANQDGSFVKNQGLPMETLNMVFFMLTVAYTLLVVPFTVFYYEGVDDTDDLQDHTTTGGQIVYALKWLIPTLLITAGVIAPMYIYIGYAEVPTTHLSGVLLSNTTDPFGGYCPDSASCSRTSVTEDIKVSVFVYIIAMVSFVGWILFSIFGGVGLFSLPFDIFLDFKNRPRPIKLSEYTAKKKVIGEIAGALMAQHEEMKQTKVKIGDASKKTFSLQGRSLRRAENEFKRDVYLLEGQYRRLELSYKQNGGNPIVVYGKLVFGVLALVLSLLWFVHLLIYVIPIAVNVQPVTPFLNNLFVTLSIAPLFGPLSYGLFAFYLLLCVIKGCIKVGMRILFIAIHPMTMGETLMSSLVFNVGLILFCSLSVVQFCTISFQQYARYTSIITIFSTQIQNLAYIRYGYSAFIFIFMVTAALTTLFLKFKPYDNPNVQKKVVV